MAQTLSLSVRSNRCAQIRLPEISQGAPRLTISATHQLTALFPDFLALYLGIHGYLKSRDELRETRERLITDASRRNSSRASAESEPRLSGETYRGAFDLPRPPTIGSFKELKRDSFWEHDNLDRIITSGSGASAFGCCPVQITPSGAISR